MKTTMLASGRLLGLWLWLAALCWNLNPVWATTITVNNTNDNVAGSLRRAIQDAGSGDTINFSVTGVITLTNGELLLTKNLTIIGPGATNLAVSGNNRSRLFEIVSTVSADVSGLMLRDGNSDRGGGVYNSGSLTMISCVAEGNFGSGVYNGGTLTLLGCTVSNNTALGNGGPGGGIYNVGTLTLSTCTVSGNSGNLGIFGTPGGIGGGIINFGIMHMTACTVSGNRAGSGAGSVSFWLVSSRGGDGGGICNFGTLSLTSCSFNGNASGSGGDGSIGAPGRLGGHGSRGGNGGRGGAIYSSGGLLTISGCTFSGNTCGQGGRGGPDAGQGGGSGGSGGSGGAIFIDPALPSPVSVRNALVAINSAGSGGKGGGGGASQGAEGIGPDLAGPFTSQGHNLIGQSDGSTGFTNGANADLIGATHSPLNPVIGPLQDNGGPTFTMALLLGSPAIDVGDDALLDGPFDVSTDQRGFRRKFGAHVDIGAFEVQPIPPSLTRPAIVGNGQFRFTLLGETNRSYTIQASTNLLNWIRLTNLISATGTNQFTAAAAPNFNRRFYRAVTP